MVSLPVALCMRATLLNLWTNLTLTLVAAAIDALVGYPDALFRAIRHPVVWLGALLSALERRLNRPDRHPRLAGIVTLILLLLCAIVPAILLQALLAPYPIGLAVLAIAASALPAQRSLWTHVNDVANALAISLDAGRTAVSRIVGRDPATLDEAAIVRAAIESLAENFSDGVVAPLLWGAIAGLPGMIGYKAINTADSMIGHRTPRYEAFGWAAARLDDLVNLPASRLSAGLLLLAAAITGVDAAGSWRAIRRDARHHRSPNAGWPEAAMAGALGLRLAGPRVYAGVLVDDGWMGDGSAAATVADLRRALHIYRFACGIELMLLAALILITWPG